MEKSELPTVPFQANVQSDDKMQRSTYIHFTTVTLDLEKSHFLTSCPVRAFLFAKAPRASNQERRSRVSA